MNKKTLLLSIFFSSLLLIQPALSQYAFSPSGQASPTDSNQPASSRFNPNYYQPPVGDQLNTNPTSEEPGLPVNDFFSRFFGGTNQNFTKESKKETRNLKAEIKKGLGLILSVLFPDQTPTGDIRCEKKTLSGQDEGTCKKVYNSPVEVVLKAIGGLGYRFRVWSGTDCLRLIGNFCVVFMNKSYTEQASFDFVGTAKLTVAVAGRGVVAIKPNNINCPPNCAVDFTKGDMASLVATADEDSVFTGWSGDCSGSESCNVTMDGAKKVTATFKEKLTVSVVGPGAVVSDLAGIDCPSDCEQLYSNGVAVTLTAKFKEGAVFMGWSGDCDQSSGATCKVTMNGRKTVSAEFKNIYKLAVILGGNGSGKITTDGIDCATIQVGDCAKFYIDGTELVLETKANDSVSVFMNWQGDCSGDNSTCALTMDGSKSVKAIYENQFALTVAISGDGGDDKIVSDPKGIDCDTSSAGAVCLHKFLNGTSVTLTALPASDAYVFDHWEGDCSGTTISCSVTIQNGPASVQAVFRKIYKLIFHIRPKADDLVGEFEYKLNGKWKFCYDNSSRDETLFPCTITFDSPQKDFQFYIFSGYPYYLKSIEPVGEDHLADSDPETSDCSIHKCSVNVDGIVNLTANFEKAYGFNVFIHGDNGIVAGQLATGETVIDCADKGTFNADAGACRVLAFVSNNPVALRSATGDESLQGFFVDKKPFVATSKLSIDVGANPNNILAVFNRTRTVDFWGYGSAILRNNYLLNGVTVSAFDDNDISLGSCYLPAKQSTHCVFKDLKNGYKYTFKLVSDDTNTKVNLYELGDSYQWGGGVDYSYGEKASPCGFKCGSYNHPPLNVLTADRDFEVYVFDSVPYRYYK